MQARIVELIEYRELMVVRDLKVRYKNSVLGILWSLLNPLLMMTVFTVVFTVMMPSNIPDFPVFVLCGLLPWNFFSASMTAATGSIVENAPLVKKVYFPREVLPLSVVLSNLVNFLIALIVLFAMIMVFRVRLTAWVLLLPLIILIQVMFTAGMAFFLSTLNVFYRDTKIIVEVLMMAWFFDSHFESDGFVGSCLSGRAVLGAAGRPRLFAAHLCYLTGCSGRRVSGVHPLQPRVRRGGVANREWRIGEL